MTKAMIGTEESPFKKVSPKLAAKSDLVRFGDIDAVDAKDLLAQFASNLDVIAEKNLLEEKKIWVESTQKNIRLAYFAKAKNALNAQWTLCGKTRHNYRNLDVRGTTIRVCDDCSHCGYNDQYVAHNDGLIGSLTDRLIQADEAAGILNWPTVDDYKKPVVPKSTVKFPSWWTGKKKSNV